MAYKEFKEKVASIFNGINTIKNGLGECDTADIYGGINLLPQDYSNRNDDVDARNDALNEAGWIANYHTCRGDSGGNCWNDNISPFHRRAEALDLIFNIFEGLQIDCGIIKFKSIEKALLIPYEYTNYEYYGNNETYEGHYIDITKMYDLLIEEGLIT